MDRAFGSQKRSKCHRGGQPRAKSPAFLGEGDRSMSRSAVRRSVIPRQADRALSRMARGSTAVPAPGSAADPIEEQLINPARVRLNDALLFPPKKDAARR